jgi:hypothetical protein
LFLRVWFSRKDVEDLSPLFEHFGAFRDSKPATCEAIVKQFFEEVNDNDNYGSQQPFWEFLNILSDKRLIA